MPVMASRYSDGADRFSGRERADSVLALDVMVLLFIFQ